VVDLGKLKFFQNRFKHDLISGAIQDPTALSQRILKPIKSELEQLDQHLFEQPVSELVAEIVGEEPKTRIRAGHQWKQPTEEYIHEVLKASKTPVDNNRQFIRDNLYAFWSPSILAYKNSFEEFQRGMNRIQLQRRPNVLSNTDVSKSLLVFKNSLLKLTQEQWTLDRVGSMAKEFADSVTYYSTEKDQLMDHGAGWKFLRWALFVGSPGLSVVPMMVLLGRDETIRRLKVARRCAKIQEQLLEAEAKKAQKARLRALTSEGQRVPDEQVSEPRNVKLRMNQEKDVGTQYQAHQFPRPIHDESHLPKRGPFWSPTRPQPIPDQKQKQKPEPLPPRHISFEEFITGQRNILRIDSPSQIKSPSPRQVNKRTKQEPAVKPEPADKLDPFEPVPPENSSGPKRMTGDERRVHFERLMANQVEDKARRQRAAALCPRLQPKRS
jgi:hypothetical protein